MKVRDDISVVRALSNGLSARAALKMFSNPTLGVNVALHYKSCFLFEWFFAVKALAAILINIPPQVVFNDLVVRGL